MKGPTMIEIREPVTTPHPETVTPLRPSEALRLGRLTRPNSCSGTMFMDSHRACALGAIAVGAGIAEDRGAYYGVTHRFPELQTRWLLDCPEAGCGFSDMCRIRRSGDLPVSSVIWHLNDRHKWSDHQIVTWLEAQGL